MSILLIGCGKGDPRVTKAAKPGDDFYQYGSVVDFGEEGNAHRYRRTGWSHVEKKITWTEGIAASLSFRVTPINRPLLLNMRMRALTDGPELPFQPVDVIVNGEKIGSWNVSPFTVYSVVIPEKFQASSIPRLIIDFYIPKATSPAQRRLSGDQRRLGLCVTDLALAPVPQEPSPTPIFSPAETR